MKKIWLFLALSPLCLGQEAPDFCDLLKNMEAWNGKLVQLHGVLKIWTGGEEEDPPSPRSLRRPDSCNRLQQDSSGKLTFPNVLELTDPQARTALHKVDFQWDRRDRRRYADMINRVDRNREQINVTVIGLFETRIPLSRLVFRGIHAGFGHAGGAPGQILVKAIEGMIIEKK